MTLEYKFLLSNVGFVGFYQIICLNDNKKKIYCLSRNLYRFKNKRFKHVTPIALNINALILLKLHFDGSVNEMINILESGATILKFHDNP